MSNPLVQSGHKDEVWSAAFSPDGISIVSAGNDGTVRAWRYRLEDLVERAISWLPRCLTAKEREDFFLDPESPPWCARFTRQTSVNQQH